LRLRAVGTAIYLKRLIAAHDTDQHAQTDRRPGRQRRRAGRAACPFLNEISRLEAAGRSTGFKRRGCQVALPQPRPA
jgi:hypothetical protein